jgi:hypothetical protein
MNNVYFKTIILFIIFIIVPGCEIAHYYETLPPPEQLVGEWMSYDGEEYIKIHNNFDTVIKNNNRKEYHFTVTGKGKRIFLDEVPFPKKPPYFEVTGRFILFGDDDINLRITWDKPVTADRPFGLYEYKGKLSLYTYVGDPDNPNSFLLLDKQP